MRQTLASALIAAAMVSVGSGGGRAWFPAIAVAAEEKSVDAAQVPKKSDAAEAAKRKLGRRLLAAAADAVPLAKSNPEWFDAGLRFSYYLRIADDQLKLADATGARETLKRAKAIVIEQDEKSRVSDFARVAEAQARAGDVVEAHETLAMAMAAAIQVEDPKGEESGCRLLFSEIIEAQLALRDIAGAEATAAIIGGAVYRDASIREHAAWKMRWILSSIAHVTSQ